MPLIIAPPAGGRPVDGATNLGGAGGSGRRLVPFDPHHRIVPCDTHVPGDLATVPFRLADDILISDLQQLRTEHLSPMIKQLAVGEIIGCKITERIAERVRTSEKRRIHGEQIIRGRAIDEQGPGARQGEPDRTGIEIVERQLFEDDVTCSGRARASRIACQHARAIRPGDALEDIGPGRRRTFTQRSEQIIGFAIAPRARSNGETDNLLGALGEGAAATGADVFERVAGANGARVLAGYARRAGSPAAGDIILEKLPFNYLYAGAVRLTLPCARTLLVNRAPADNLFAMYSTLFGSAYPFSYSFGDLAAYYFAYSELLDHWRKVLGPQLLEVAYENVVSEPERNGRKIAGHMGIAWDDAMVRIERNKTASATASAAQIRRPIYRTAAGRWRNYERHLRPLLDLLEAGGIDPFRARNGPEER